MRECAVLCRTLPNPPTQHPFTLRYGAGTWISLGRAVFALNTTVGVTRAQPDTRRHSHMTLSIYGNSFFKSGISFNVTSIVFSTFYVTAVTVACNGYLCGSHALCVYQGCQAACLSHTGPIQRRLTYSFAAVFTDLSLRPSTVPTASVASFDCDEWT